MMRVAILVSGHGSNMRAIVTRCRDGRLGEVCEPVVVASNNPDAPALAVAQDLGVATACVPSKKRKRRDFDHDLIEALSSYQPDLLILAGFMRILGPEVIARWPGRILNIHPADPRAYQGAHGYSWAWEQRLDETHVTVHLVDEGMDTGPIIAQAPVDLRGAGSVDEVKRRGLKIEHGFYADILERVCRGDVDLNAIWRRS